VQFEELEICPSNVLGGNPSGVLSLRVKESKELREMQHKLFRELEKRFGPCPAEHDHDYVFHMTVALGGAPYENYERAYHSLRADKQLEWMLCEEFFTFSRLGLLYYDDDEIHPGTYFCYKVVDLR
uniref:2'-5' RNA ligase family protein n=1 Tax=Acetatifactor sp. TaxID=1872090 RepID=UPI0040569E61